MATNIISFNDSGRKVYAKICWDVPVYSIEVYSDKHYTGHFSIEDMHEAQEHVLESEEEYKDNLKKYFENNTDEVEFALTNKGAEMLFTWKKKFADGVAFKHGSVKLTQAADTNELPLDKLIQFFQEELRSKKTLQNTITHLQERIIEQDKLFNLVKNEYSNLEATLLSKFALVLNSQKKKNSEG